MKVGTRLVKFYELKDLLNQIDYSNVLQVLPVCSGNSQEFLVIYKESQSVSDIEIGDYVQVFGNKNIEVGKVEYIHQYESTGQLKFKVTTLDNTYEEWIDEFFVSKIYGEVEDNK